MELLLLDKREIFREGLAMVLNKQPGMKVIGTCASVSECIEKARQLRPDVVIIDTELEKHGGVEASRRVHEILPTAGILILTHSESEHDLFDTMKAGARGYVTKDVNLSDLVRTIRIIADGGVIVSPPMALKVLQEFAALGTFNNTEGGKNEPSLSNREQEVLSLLADGPTNKTIADKLFITENTVKVHLRNIMEKLQVHSRLQAALLAQEKGFVKQTDNNTKQ